MIPTSTNISIDIKTKPSPDTEAIAIFITDGGDLCGDVPHLISGEMMKSVDRLIAAKVASGKLRDIVFDLVDVDLDRGKILRIYLVGLGKFEKLDMEAIRQGGGALARAARKHKLSKLSIVPPVLKNPQWCGAQAAVVGFLLASFDYDEYRGSATKQSQEKSPSPKRLNLTILSTENSIKENKELVDRGRILADAQNFARTIAFRPGNDINPPSLAKVAQQMANEVGLRCKILDEKQMQKLGMGGILAVGAGSSKTPPRIIVLEHLRGKKSSKPLLVVGKAVTFDTGGISIKPAEKMGKMVFDKCGAMAVLGLMYAAAKMKLPVNLVGILSSAENHISETAYRPGDILKMYNGVTVEVTNTDAEGRLVLGDAMAWGVETYKPAAMIDLATLTGGVIVALGRNIAGMMGNSNSLCDELNEITKITGEKLWRLPLGPEQREQIKSDVADIVNSAGREAHVLQGGAFLSHFVPDDDSVAWAHLDIAGVADTDRELPYYGKGATGFGVRTLVQWVEGRLKTESAIAKPKRERSGA